VNSLPAIVPEIEIAAECSIQDGVKVPVQGSPWAPILGSNLVGYCPNCPNFGTLIAG